MVRFITPPPRVDASAFVAEAIRGAFMSSGIGYFAGTIDEIASDQPPAWQTWSIGLLVISFCSVTAPLGIVILPWLLPAFFYQHLMTFLIALGVGALSGSCFFIMVPQAFTIATLQEIDYETKSWIMIATLYVFFVIDRLLQYGIEFRRRRRAAKKAQAVWDVTGKTPEAAVEMGKTNLHKGGATSIDSQKSLSDMAACNVTHAYGACDKDGMGIEVAGVNLEEPKEQEIANVAYMIVFGSSLNNFVDGMSTGAAFSDSILKGISIGIAVVSEQFPQELGTLAILINSGLGLKRAIILNMVANGLSLAGFVAGVCLDELDDTTDSYIFAISSGMYLYIFIGTIMPELRDGVATLMKRDMRESLIVTAIQFSGIACGVCLMYFMGKMGSSVQLE